MELMAQKAKKVKLGCLDHLDLLVISDYLDHRDHLELTGVICLEKKERQEKRGHRDVEEELDYQELPVMFNRYYVFKALPIISDVELK